MKLRDTLLGLVVLALVLGGIWWVRGRSPAGKAPARDVAINTAASVPDVTLADQGVDVGGVRFVLSLESRPILAFTKNRFRVRAELDGAPLDLLYSHLSFEMSMPMGDHRYRLVPGADGWQEAEVILPACGSGHRRWFAIVEGTAGGRRRSARFQFDLTPPSRPSPPAP
ncbi:MAG: hypothetical protein HY900_06700 [Deltaproteobacteria bacterium]|nr:hypothetical protein [Deltaproteobacteria bacterium]